MSTRPSKEIEGILGLRVEALGFRLLALGCGVSVCIWLTRVYRVFMQGLYMRQPSRVAASQVHKYRVYGGGLLKGPGSTTIMEKHMVKNKDSAMESWFMLGIIWIRFPYIRSSF